MTKICRMCLGVAKLRALTNSFCWILLQRFWAIDSSNCFDSPAPAHCSVCWQQNQTRASVVAGLCCLGSASPAAAAPGAAPRCGQSALISVSELVTLWIKDFFLKKDAKCSVKSRIAFPVSQTVKCNFKRTGLSTWCRNVERNWVKNQSTMWPSDSGESTSWLCLLEIKQSVS